MNYLEHVLYCDMYCYGDMKILLAGGETLVNIAQPSNVASFISLCLFEQGFDCLCFGS